MAQSNAETLHFVIEGASLTNLCRQLWADEGEPEKAFRILGSAFPDMCKADIGAILVGEKKLIGDSTIGCDLVDDDVELSPHGNLLSVEAVIGRFRTKLDDLEDWKEMAIGRTTKMASPKGLVAIPTRKQRAYTEGRVALDDIPYREIEARVPDLGPRISSDEIPIKEVKLDPPKASYTINSRDGWLSPDGKFYTCYYGEHIALAEALGFTERELEKKQWMKIQEGGCHPPEKEKLSQKQRDLVFDWYTSRKKELPWWFDDEYYQEQ
jgi:hypothetical protein